MRVIVGNQVYVQAADPAVDRAYRIEATSLIKKLQDSLPKSLHYEWVDTTIFDKPISYADVRFNVGEVDPAYDDLIIYFMPTWRGEGHAQGEYSHNSLAFDGKDAIAIWGLPGNDPQSLEDAVEGVESALRFYRDTLVHELVHYYDQKRYPEGKKPKTYKAPDPRYYNSPQEFNAFFQAWATLQDKRLQENVLKEAEPGTIHALSKFHTYFSDSPERFVQYEAKRGAFKELTPKMRRHFLKRAYQLWKYLRDKTTAGKDLSSPAAHISNEQQLRQWLSTVEDEVRMEVSREWEEWADDSLMLKDLVTIMSSPENFVDLAQDYSGTGADWIVKSLPTEYQDDYLEAMEQLRQELVAQYSRVVPKAASYREALVSTLAKARGR